MFLFYLFEQWLGEAVLRSKMQGRLIVVHLVCRDMTVNINATAQAKGNSFGIFCYFLLLLKKEKVRCSFGKMCQSVCV